MQKFVRLSGFSVYKKEDFLSIMEEPISVFNQRLISRVSSENMPGWVCLDAAICVVVISLPHLHEPCLKMLVLKKNIRYNVQGINMCFKWLLSSVIDAGDTGCGPTKIG